MAAPAPSWWKTVDGLDRGIYQAERVCVLSFAAAMSLLVFAAVYLDLFNKPTPDPVRWAQMVWPSVPPSLPLAATAVLWFGLLFAGIRHAGSGAALPTLAQASGVFLLSLGLGVGLRGLFPTGIPSYQKLAMGFFVWIMLLGGSMAAYRREHLQISAAAKLVSPARRNLHVTVASAATALICAVLTWVSAGYVSTRISDWVASDYAAGLIGATSVPAWLMTLAIPVAFGLMSLRFAKRAVGVFLGHLPANKDEEAPA